jgi:hypothetical protein
VAGDRRTTFITDDPVDHFQIETSFDFRFFSSALAKGAPVFGNDPFLTALLNFIE